MGWLITLGWQHMPGSDCEIPHFIRDDKLPECGSDLLRHAVALAKEGSAAIKSVSRHTEVPLTLKAQSRSGLAASSRFSRTRLEVAIPREIFS
jgi:hypothetical protein